ncbi:hypothetical protein AU106_gp043 [Sinorhizobium phage phiM9]|uniref:Uncharacterized protein n=1 Tax=Sinorhizobium phage phiM9 TaxID=1636182 RepID=A0A0F6TGK9_9CAUD|nr:hypothetical protein AU106_gp043 [Sinorhizobium phage phiM9]AKE44674.1 hypothetical protein Sm_phiM9_044 [Sinorhizobium phage phiM9]
MESVRNKIINGDYKNKLPYPEKPMKPFLPSKHTSAEAKEYVKLLEEYEVLKEAWQNKVDVYNEETRELAVKFQEDLEAEFGMTGHPKAAKLFGKAWEHGHSGGLLEIHNWYSNLYELVI